MHMRVTLSIVFFTFSVFCSTLLFGQTYNVKQISGLKGLSQNTVNSICVDSVGYIWLGTDFGLNRYDGRSIKQYYCDSEDQATIADDFVNLVYQDRKKDIWISTSGGICRYNRNQDTFLRNPLQLEGNVVCNSIYEDDDELWFPSSDLVFHIYNKTSETTRDLKVLPLYETNRKSWELIDIIDYTKDSLLILIEGKGLALLNKKTGELSEFLNINTQRFTDVEDIGNVFFLSSQSDVFKVTREGKIESQFSKVNSNHEDPIYLNIKQNPGDSSVWIATDCSGVFIVDDDLKVIDKLESGPHSDHILPENSIKNIYFVNEQTVILGTVRCGGIILYASHINQYSYSKEHDSGPSDKSILCFEEDRDGKIWIGTDGGGMNWFDRETNTFSSYESPKVQIVTSILDYSENHLLVASYQKGLFFFDKRTKQFSEAAQHELFKPITSNVRIKLFRDSENNIWVSDGGLVKINVDKNSFERLGASIFSEFFTDIYSIYYSAYESKSRKIWFGTVGGMFSYSLNTGRFVDRIILRDIDSSAGNTVYTIEEDKHGNLILGTSKGLKYYDTKTGVLQNYIDDPSYKNKRFSSLYIDTKQQLWAGTNDALLRITTNGEGKEISVFNNIGFGGGKEYRHGAVLRSSDNRLYLGSNDGIIAFIPEEVDIDKLISKVVITSFKKIGNKKGELSDSTIIVDNKQNLQTTFNYSPSIYQLKFNAFNIPFEEFTEYEYTLENFENIWHRGTSNTATYTNLSAGEYIFKVRSTNRTGQWCTNTTNIGIKILPPWYETAWFLALAIILISLSIIAIWRESLVRLKLKHQLELQETEQEQLKVSNQHKLQFFTNISHELKTPLTLIFSPLKQLLRKNISEAEIKTALPSLYRNVRRMMVLIDQLLEFRKSEMSTLKMKLSKADCIEVCEEVIDYFEYYSKNEGIKLILEAEQEQMEVELDRDKFIKIMFNLISNALKHSKSGDSVFITVSWDDDNIRVQVRDDGPGIHKEDQGHIFERYYQLEKEEAGTGIGLALTKHLVEIHGGKISIESQVGEGAVFTVVLPQKQKGTIEQSVDEKQKLFEKMENFVSSPALLNINVQKEIKILVVEDEWELRHFLRNELSVAYSVITAGNGKEGFSAAVKNVPDLIISDVMMPEMNGYQLCDRIKNDIRISHIPLVLLTAKTQSEHHAQGLKAGADMYIPKPFDLEILKLQIATLIRNRQLLKNRFSTDPEIKSDELTHNSLDQAFMDKAIKLVEENMENQHFKVSDFVEQMGMSRSLVYNKINAIAGKPVKDFILNIRLQKAGKLITSSNKPISEIAYQCGFTDPSYFSTVFKRYYFQSPVSYRNNYLKESLTSNEISE